MGTPLSLSQLSSLDLVRGFVAVGRRMSVTLAAQDLCLSQSAVSRQVHALEEQLGVKLLVRSHRSIAFTPEGERLFNGADDAVRQLQDVMGDVRTRGQPRPVTLTSSIGIAGLWLLPRLGHFQRRHPRVDVRVAASDKLCDMREDGIDLALRYTTTALAPAGASRLFGESIAPVAHPSLGIGSLRGEGTLSTLTLLEFDNPRYPWLQWKDWIGAMGLGRLGRFDRQSVLRFNQYDLTIHAALAGQGVALGRLELIQPFIDEGRLVVIDPPARQPETAHAYWLIQAEAQPRKEVREVAAWIEAQAKAIRAVPDL
jgi:LysR family glycine cleavage system transcriptional activator